MCDSMAFLAILILTAATLATPPHFGTLELLVRTQGEGRRNSKDEPPRQKSVLATGSKVTTLRPE